MSDRNWWHPDLRCLSDREFTLRSGWWSFFFPESIRILWFGDMKHANGIGMYATRAQHDSWPDLHVNSGIVAGPG